MKALLLYNPVSGHHRIKKKIDYISSYLKDTYDVLDVKESNSKKDFISILKDNIDNYDDYIIAGGDGSINMAVNVVASFPHRPNLAFLPFGTLNGGVRNLECPSSIKGALKAIKNHHVKEVDIVKVNDSKYFTYCATIGAYSDIPVLAKNKKKQLLGRFAYYFMAIPLLFKKVRVSGYITYMKNKIYFNTPFIVILNGKKMGGFKINKKSMINDGKIELMYGKNGIFNSLPQYFVNKGKVTILKGDEFDIEVKTNLHWNIDGEETEFQNINIKVLHNFLKIISF